MTSFEDLSRDHYPEHGKWVMQANYTKERFTSNPYYAPWTIHKSKLISPSTGILEVQVGDTIRFAIEYAEPVDAIQVNTNVERNPSIWKQQQTKKRQKPVYVLDPSTLDKQCYVLFRQDGKCYDFEYVITNSSIYYIDILFDHERIMRFKVKMKP